MPEIVGDVALGWTVGTLTQINYPPNSITGSVVLAFAPQAWLSVGAIMGIEADLFSFQGFVGEVLIAETETFDVSHILPALLSTIEVAVSGEITGDLPGLVPDIRIDAAPEFQIDSVLSGLLSTIELERQREFTMAGQLAGLIIDALIHEANDFAFDGVLDPLLTFEVAEAGKFSTDCLLPALMVSMDIDSQWDIAGRLSPLSFEFDLSASGVFEFTETLPALATDWVIDAFSWAVICPLPGLTSDVQLAPIGDATFYGDSLRLIGNMTLDIPGDILIDTTFPVLQSGYVAGSIDIDGVLPGLVFEGLRANGLDVFCALPLLRGERIFDTASGCHTRYL